MDGETLASGSSRSSKDGSAMFAESVLEGSKDEVVEDLGVVAGEVKTDEYYSGSWPVMSCCRVLLVHFTTRPVAQISACQRR
jgi:hypothetical protein